MNGIPTFEATGGNWLTDVVNGIRTAGVAVLGGVLDAGRVQALADATLRAQEGSVREVGSARLDAAGEQGVVRLPMRFDPEFFSLFEVEEILTAVDAVIGPTSVCHLQNAFVLPSLPPGLPPMFQNSLHRDFPRYLGGYVASLNALVCLTPFREDTGATKFILGSHQRQGDLPPTDAKAVDAEAEPGTVVFFDSTIWHCSGQNTSGSDRLGINHQFTRSYFKQQIDYSRALGEELVGGLPETTKRLMGWYTRVPTSLDEYYRPPDERLYRAGQG